MEANGRYLLIRQLRRLTRNTTVAVAQPPRQWATLGARVRQCAFNQHLEHARDQFARIRGLLHDFPLVTVAFYIRVAAVDHKGNLPCSELMAKVICRPAL